jgi:drug/metabolite transporter (DMT)-like permease
MKMSQTIKAVMFMSGAIVSFSAMAVAGRAISFELDTFEIMMYRSIVGICVVLILGRMFGTLGQITKRNLGTHFIRNISHFAGQNLWFYAITVVPLAQVFALEFTSPLWVLLLSPLLLNERWTQMRVLAGVMGFVGILIVTRPTGQSLNIGVIAAALSAIGFAGSAIFTKRLTRTETITCILFYLTVMQLAFGVICAGYDGDIAMPSLDTLPWLVLIGFAGLLAHFCLTTALSLAPATVVMPVDFIRLPVIAMVGMLVYAEAIDMWVFIGAAIIFTGNYMNIWSETRKA